MAGICFAVLIIPPRGVVRTEKLTAPELCACCAAFDYDRLDTLVRDL